MSKKVQNKALIAERKAKRKSEKRRRNIIIIVVAVLTVAVITAISIISSLPTKFTDSDGRLTNTKTGEVYIQAPDYYEPVSYKQEPYGKCGDNYIYPVTGMNTSDWLTVDDYGIFRILCKDTSQIPSLKDFSSVEIKVCDDGDKVVQVASIEDKEDISSIVDTILNGESVSKPDASASVYSLRIASSKYTWMYYRITFVIAPDSSCYYYDRTFDRCVAAEDNIIFEAIKGATEYQDEEASSIGSNENAS